MREPLLDSRDQDLEAQLLRAGKDVYLSPAAQGRLLTALGIAAGVSTAGKAAASVGFFGKLLGSKGVVVATSVVSAGALGASIYLTASQPSEHPAVPVEAKAIQTSMATPPSGEGARQDAAGASPGGVLEAAPPGERLESEPKASDAHEIVRSTKAAPRPVATPSKDGLGHSKDGLRKELALVEAASRATKSGNGQLAIQHLAEYRKSFPQGKLALEAQVLRIEALALAGHQAEAARLSQAFLKRYPNSPVAARIRRYAGP
jgi:hypothetical protein